MIESLPPVNYPRTPGMRPQPDDNPYGAWAVKTRIQGARRGKLTGKRVAIKDNVCVAGVPMMNGASILEGYVPEIDATIVTRLLDEGAEILGKSVCEYYCASGGSHTSANGVVENPVVPRAQRGGLVIGIDRAGDGRARGHGDRRRPGRLDSDSGVLLRAVGLKPTHGLVPYTGIFAVELTVDHAGPITRTVADNALMLEVIAGPDVSTRASQARPVNHIPRRSRGVLPVCASASCRKGLDCPARKPRSTPAYATQRIVCRARAPMSVTSRCRFILPALQFGRRFSWRERPI